MLVVRSRFIGLASSWPLIITCFLSLLLGVINAEIRIIRERFSTVEENEQCDNAIGGGTGVCTVTQACSPAMALVRRDGRVMSLETLKLLRNAHCGFIRDHPLICCPNSTISLNVTTPANGNSSLLGDASITSSNSTMSPEHPKISVLPLDTCGYSISDKLSLPPNILQLSDVRPTVARIIYELRNGTKIHRCGGSLICDRYVLTAAHCVSPLPNGTTISEVILGDFDLTTDPDCEERPGQTMAATNIRICQPNVQRVNVQNITIHPTYEPSTLQNDLALLRIDPPANFTSELDVIAVCLPLGEYQFNNPPEAKSWATWSRTAGWGTLLNGTSQFTKRHYGVVRTDNNTLCAADIKFNATSQFCVEGKHQTDILVVDSGGPLTMIDILRPDDGPRMIQIGVESFSLSNQTADSPPVRVFTRVRPHLTWILDNIE